MTRRSHVEKVNRVLHGGKPGNNGEATHARPTPAAQPEEPELAPKERLTDLGNARRVVARHGMDWRFCHPFKQSFIFDGKRWRPDDTAAAVRLVKDTQGAVFLETAQKIYDLGDVGDDKERREKLQRFTKLLKHCLAWEDARKISACLQLATSEPGIPVLPAELDTDPMLLNVLNGTLDLRTGKLREHRREDLMTKIAPVQYDPAATCPLWDKVLVRVMGGKQPLITYLQRTAGYSLTADVGEQCLFFLHGAGANGKSTYLKTLKDLMGDYAIQTVAELLMAKHHESHPTERADLCGRRFIATIETDDGKRMAEALMKQLTGGDSVRARKMKQDFFEFNPTWKIFMAANHRPKVSGGDHGVWRRIKLIPFTVTIPENEKDKNLLAKLKREWPGILAWAVRGCLDWQLEGLAEPEEVRTATASYRAEQDILQGFLDECCFIHADAKIQSSALLECYLRWSGEKTMTAPVFRQKLNEKGFQSKRGHGGNYFYQGIGLTVKSADDDDIG